MIPNAVCDKHDEETRGRNPLDHPKLKEADGVRKLCAAIEGRIQEHFVVAYIEGNTLWIGLSHPAIIQEFNSTKEAILERMRKIYQNEGLAKAVQFKKVKPILRAAERKTEPLQHPDRCSGEFEILSKDPEISKVFGRIRSNIKAAHTKGQHDV